MNPTRYRNSFGWIAIAIGGPLAFWILASNALGGTPLRKAAPDVGEAESEGYVQVVEELFQSEVVYPQEKGAFQFTLCPSWHKEVERELGRGSFLLEYGLTDSWEVGVKWDAWVYSKPKGQRGVRGVGDVEIETKYSFMNIAGSGFHAAAGFGVQFPTGSVDKEISEGFIEYEPFVVIARDFPSLHHLQIFTQAGVSLVQRVKTSDNAEEVEPAAHELHWSGGLLIPFGRMVFSSELTWTTNRWNHGGDENEWYFTPGLTLKLPNDLEIGAGVPVGLTSGSDRHRFILQVTKEF